MSYRMYLTNDTAPAITPAVRSTWGDSTALVRKALSTSKAGANTSNSRAETTATNPFDVCLGQWISEPMAHGGTFYLINKTAVVAISESDAAADFQTRTAVRVLSGDGTVIRGEVGSFSGPGFEVATTLTAQDTTITGDTTEVTALPGDRLVVEFGYRAANAVTTSYTGTIRYGGTDATDLVAGDTGGDATSRSPWIEFSDPRVATLWDTWGTAAWEGSIGGYQALEAAWGADLTADPDEWAWSDITADVRHEGGIELTHGRGDEAGSAQPAQLRALLDNRAGAYSLGPQSANYPYVRRQTPIRHRVDVGDGWVTLFQGGADAWNPRWAGGPSGDAVVALTASGALRRLGQGASPVQSTLRRRLSGLDSVVAYWPMEDAAGADVASSAFEGHPPMAYTTGTPTFGANSPIAGAASLVTLSGARFVGQVPAYADTGAINVRMLITWSGALPDDAVILRVYAPGGSAVLWDVLAGSGANDAHLQLKVYDSTGSLLEDTLDTGPFDPITRGATTLLSLEWEQVGGDVVWNVKLYEPGAPGARTFGTSTISGETVGAVTYVEINPDGAIDGVPVGHLYVQNDSSSVFEGSTEFNAYRYEEADDRLVRLCDENDTELDVVGTAGIEMGPQLPKTLLELLAEVERTDQGILYDGTGPGLTYICRSERESQDADLTLDASAGEVDDLIPVDDDQRTRNVVQASRESGGSATFADVDGPMGTAAIGIYDDSVTVNSGGDTELADYASWFVHAGTVRGYRYPSMGLQLHRDPHLAEDWVATQLGARIDVTNVEDVRTQHPTGTISLALEGYRQRIDRFTWWVDLTCSPYELWQVGTLAATSGDTSEHVLRLEGDGSTLAAGASAGATSLSVATASGPLWTTTADDCPLTIEVEGTPITVTAIAGGSSPQTFTVTGATVVRALSSGAAVTLYQPRVLGLPE